MDYPLSTFAQGNLNPPGPPGAAMKALDQIQPRTIINASNTPGTSESLYKITQPGSYYFTGNLTGVSGKNGIEIAATNVIIDLNGFTLMGVPGSRTGIVATNGGAYVYAGLRVRNGAITGWGEYGINTIFAGSPGAFSSLTFQNNGTGLSAVQSLMTDCIAQNNGTGITGNQNRIFNCIAVGNSTGFGAFNGSLVEGCVATTNSTGIIAASGSRIINNVVNANTTGLSVADFCRVSGNLITGPANSPGTGILFATGSGTTVESNMMVSNSTAGLSLTSLTAVRHLVTGNLAQGNGTNYLITSTNNAYGPVANVGGVGDISAFPIPWYNFSY